MRFNIDPTAARMPADNSRLQYDDVRPLLKGIQPVCESIQDNDMERWAMTQGGQFLRQTGHDGSRYYVVPPDEAVDFLSGFCDEKVFEDVCATLSRHGIEYRMPMTMGM